MSVTAALELAMKREELVAHVDLLTLPSKADRPDPDDGKGETWPLLVAVEYEQSAHGGPALRSTTLASTRSPVRLTATELLIDVDRVVGTSRPGGRSVAVRGWSARAGSSPELGVVADAADTAAGWVTTARAVLEHRRWLPLRGAQCPECGRRQVVAPGHSGEDIVEPALAADTRTGSVHCAADGCGAAWPAEHLHLLADVLRAQTEVDVLAVIPDDA